MTGNHSTPLRGSAHDALSAFLGDWCAEGTSYGGTDQSGADPKANGVAWASTHTARWHSGKFFLIQDERALIGGSPFDTLGVIGTGSGNGKYIARTFENHGFYRHYEMTFEDRTWLLEGETERARTIFDVDGDIQTISWEWLRDGKWLPLCDRVATRVRQADRPADRAQET